MSQAGSSGEPPIGPGTRWCGDPAEVLDELVQELGEGRPIWSGLELDALAGWIFTTLGEHPMKYEHIKRWIRIQRPRLLPGAVDFALHELANRHLVECDDAHIWRSRSNLPIGFSLRRRAA